LVRPLDPFRAMFTSPSATERTNAASGGHSRPVLRPNVGNRAKLAGSQPLTKPLGTQVCRRASFLISALRTVNRSENSLSCVPTLGPRWPGLSRIRSLSNAMDTWVVLKDRRDLVRTRDGSFALHHRHHRPHARDLRRHRQGASQLTGPIARTTFYVRLESEADDDMTFRRRPLYPRKRTFWCFAEGRFVPEAVIGQFSSRTALPVVVFDKLLLANDHRVTGDQRFDSHIAEASSLHPSPCSRCREVEPACRHEQHVETRQQTRDSGTSPIIDESAAPISRLSPAGTGSVRTYAGRRLAPLRQPSSYWRRNRR